MLKIKSNTNEFTIIFSEKIGKKINAEKFSVPALFLFLLQRPFFFFLPFWSARRLFSVQPSFFLFCFSTSFLFLFSASAPLSFVFYSALLFLLSASFLLHLAPPFCCLLVTLRFFLFFLTCCPIFFSPNTFLAQELFQPKTFFSPLHFICGSAPPSFCQLPRPKIFSLAASHLFYLSKSLFSSNLE